VNHKPDGRLPLLSARPAVTTATIKRAATNFYCLVNRGTMGVNSLPKTVTWQRHGCDLDPGFCAWVQHADQSATEPPWQLLVCFVYSNPGFVFGRLLLSLSVLAVCAIIMLYMYARCKSRLWPCVAKNDDDGDDSVMFFVWPIVLPGASQANALPNLIFFLHCLTCDGRNCCKQCVVNNDRTGCCCCCCVWFESFSLFSRKATITQ